MKIATIPATVWIALVVVVLHTITSSPGVLMLISIPLLVVVLWIMVLVAKEEGAAIERERTR